MISAASIALAAGVGVSAVAPQDEPPVEESTPDHLQEAKRLLADQRPADAESLARQLLLEGEATHGADSLQVANVLVVLAAALKDGKEHREAKEVYDSALKIQEAQLGPEHLDVATTLHEMAGLQLIVGDYRGAKSTWARSLAIRERQLGPDHVAIAESLEGLATAHSYLAAHADAKRLFESALAMLERLLGAEHVEVAETAKNLAMALRGMGAHAEAKSYLERALAIFENQIGGDHPGVAATLNNLGLVAQDQGSYAEARRLFERALALREERLGPDHPDVALILNNLAVLLSTTGAHAEARPMFERALGIREQQLGPAHADVGMTLVGLAWLLRNTGEYAQARSLLERALEIGEKRFGPDNPAVAGVLNTLAVVLTDLGAFSEARSIHGRALAIREAAFGSKHLDIAESLDNLGSLLLRMGSPEEARSPLERALAIREEILGPEHPLVGRTLNNLGLVLRASRAITEAVAALERALAIQEKTLPAGHPSVANTAYNLGLLRWNLGAYAEAKPLFERALVIRETTLGPDHPEVAQSLHALAMLLGAMGSLEEARGLSARALAIREARLGPEHPEVAASLVILGSILGGIGARTEAVTLLERALSIQEKSDPNGRAMARSLFVLGNFHRDLGDYARAKPLLERALDIQERTDPGSPQTGLTLACLGEVLTASNGFSGASRSFERALSILEENLGATHPHVGSVLGNLARSLYVAGEAQAALARALEAAEVGRKHLRVTVRVLPERLALSFASRRRNNLDLVLSLVAHGMGAEPVRDAWDATLRSRGLVLDEMAARRGSAAADPEASQAWQQWLQATTRLANLTVRSPADISTESYRRLLDDARKERERAEEALAAESARFRAELGRGRIGFREVVGALPSGTALVAYVRYFDHGKPGAETPAEPVASYLAFVLSSPAGPPVVVPLGSADEIDERVERWRELAGNEPAAGASVTCAAAGSRLREAVWDPVAPHVSEAARAFVVPDGALNLVNFGALPSVSGSYLIERRPLLHSVSAERDLLGPGEARRYGDGILVVGDPAYDESSLFAALAGERERPSAIASSTTYRGSRSACGDFESLRFARLPASAAEVRDVIRLWRDDDGDAVGLRLTGAAATESAFKASATGRRVLHLATHGFFLGEHCRSALDTSRGIAKLALDDGKSPRPVSGENPLLLSGLALAGANHRAAAGPDEEDGILTAEEIAALDLAGVEWAVLSACDTGLGEIKAGEGVFGLRRAFQVAGAQTLIMSLWAVEDESARAWMRALYEARLVKGMDTAESVREASLTVLRDRRARGESTHPFYWAGFVAAGDWR